ncbi:heparin lyase I family protein [Kitasatospora purpeofusca]|uniref:heparin lyase I family protein n=1 Tax=Kitasatospora purpeofusca TaxID=67352 RepID=UPI0036BC673D
MSQHHRRRLRVSALLAALVAVGAASIGPTATAASTTVPFSDGFESGNTGLWPRKGIAGKGTVDIVAAPGGRPGRAARFTMPDAGDSYRSEIATSRLPYGSYRYTFSNYLPPEWISYPYATIVSQWHSGTGTVPPVVLAVRADRWIMVVHWKAGSGSLSEATYDLGPARLARWNQWTFDISWSTASAPGSAVARLDGAAVGSHQGPNNYGQDGTPYHKIGLYRPNWQAAKGYVSRGTPSVVVDYDDVSITPIPTGAGDPPTATAAPTVGTPSSSVPAATTPVPATPTVPTTSAPPTREPTPAPSGRPSSTATSLPPARPATTEPAAVPPPASTPTATAGGAVVPTSAPGAADDIPTEADTDTDNGGERLADTGSPGPTPLALSAGGVLAATGIALVLRLRRRNARRPAQHARTGR